MPTPPANITSRRASSSGSDESPGGTTRKKDIATFNASLPTREPGSPATSAGSGTTEEIERHDLPDTPPKPSASTAAALPKKRGAKLDVQPFKGAIASGSESAGESSGVRRRTNTGTDNPENLVVRNPDDSVTVPDVRGGTVTLHTAEQAQEHVDRVVTEIVGAENVVPSRPGESGEDFIDRVAARSGGDQSAVKSFLKSLLKHTTVLTVPLVKDLGSTGPITYGREGVINKITPALAEWSPAGRTAAAAIPQVALGLMLVATLLQKDRPTAARAGDVSLLSTLVASLSACGAKGNLGPALESVWKVIFSQLPRGALQVLMGAESNIREPNNRQHAVNVFATVVAAYILGQCLFEGVATSEIHSGTSGRNEGQDTGTKALAYFGFAGLVMLYETLLTASTSVFKIMQQGVDKPTGRMDAEGKEIMEPSTGIVDSFKNLKVTFKGPPKPDQEGKSRIIEYGKALGSNILETQVTRAVANAISVNFADFTAELDNVKIHGVTTSQQNSIAANNAINAILEGMGELRGKGPDEKDDVERQTPGPGTLTPATGNQLRQAAAGVVNNTRQVNTGQVVETELPAVPPNVMALGAQLERVQTIIEHAGAGTYQPFVMERLPRSMTIQSMDSVFEASTIRRADTDLSEGSDAPLLRPSRQGTGTLEGPNPNPPPTIPEDEEEQRRS